MGPQLRLSSFVLAAEMLALVRCSALPGMAVLTVNPEFRWLDCNYRRIKELWFWRWVLSSF